MVLLMCTETSTDFQNRIAANPCVAGLSLQLDVKEASIRNWQV